MRSSLSNEQSKNSRAKNEFNHEPVTILENHKIIILGKLTYLVETGVHMRG